MPTTYLPDALLLDFGGVIVETVKHRDGRQRLTSYLRKVLLQVGWEVNPVDLRHNIDAGLTALKHWKNAASRRREPTELTAREIVADFLAADLPAGPRAALTAEASAVLAFMNTALSAHTVRPGIRELLELCGTREIPVGIVSNAHSGRSHRNILVEEHLDTYFGVQVYSDEVGLRKPHPLMLHLAAEALEVDIARCWYVGDTMDRDVVAGRRAGVGAMLVTRTRHTDNPPFAVSAQADHIFDTPRGVFELLEQARPVPEAGGPEPAPLPSAENLAVKTEDRLDRPVIFIDHGGVIAEANRTHEVLTDAAEEIVAFASRAGHTVELPDALAALDYARAANKARKRDLAAQGNYREVTAPEFWGDFVGSQLPPAVQALLRIEAADLMVRYYLTKAKYQLRPGARELLEYCQAANLTVVIVSNTVSGRGVRARLRQFGLDRLIDAGVYSDELGLRKPDPAIFTEALALAGADPANAWFIGDKPFNDAAGAQGVGIRRRILVRGGSTDDAALEAALADGTATDLVTTPDDIIALLTTATEHPALAPLGVTS
jgi:HAD superfamily hydrolase (TIGR01549 family)